MKIKEAVDFIRGYLPDASSGVFNSSGIRVAGCDGIKYGDPEQECTGIVCTVFASVDVIHKAKELGANLIVTHEGTFFSNDDSTDWLKENRVYLEKKKILDENNTVILRIHDAMHMHPTSCDYISCGIAEKLGWTQYAVDDQKKPSFFRLPETTGLELAKRIIEKCRLNGIRVLGDLNRKVSTVFFGIHFFGVIFEGKPDKDKISSIADAQPDVVILGETVDYTINAYAHDAAALGIAPLVFEYGHFNWEEPGMLFAEKWISESLNHQIPVFPVQSGDAFSYVVK